MPRVTRYELPEIARRLVTERACFAYLDALRWPESRFLCPCCGGRRSYLRSERLARQCANRKCERVVSVKAGTRMERSRQPLRAWITAAALMAMGGVSAAALQRTLRLKRYAVAHAMVSAIGEAPVAYEPEPLSGEVLVEEFMVPGVLRAILSAGEIADGKIRRRCYRLAPRFGVPAVTSFLRTAIDLKNARLSVGPALRSRAKTPGEVPSAGLLAQLSGPLGEPRSRRSVSTQEGLNAIAFRQNFRDDESGAVAHLLGIRMPEP